MFEVRNIIYFTPFYFKNGNPAKNKYFVVLKCIGDFAVLASIPTSKDYIPNNIEQNGGCIELPDINLNCFVITPKMCVTECGKYFPLNTYLYGQNIDDFEITILKELYPLENTNKRKYRAILSS